jgi:Fe-S-cluster containining protein
MTWKCHPDCKGECCGIVPIPYIVFKSNEDVIQCTPKRVDTIRLKDKRAVVLPVTDDLKCVFLNRETFKCAIYEERPDVCRLYGQNVRLLCAYVDMTGKFRGMRDRVRVARILDKKAEKKLSALRKHTKGGLAHNEQEKPTESQ